MAKRKLGTSAISRDDKCYINAPNNIIIDLSLHWEPCTFPDPYLYHNLIINKILWGNTTILPLDIKSINFKSQIFKIIQSKAKGSGSRLEVLIS